MICLLDEVYIMNFGVLSLFLCISTLSYYNCRNSAVQMIKKRPISNTTPANWICTTPNWLKIMFKIDKRQIPKYLYLELILSLVFATLGPACFLIFLISDCSMYVVGILVMLQASLIIINLAYFSIMTVRYCKVS